MNIEDLKEGVVKAYTIIEDTAKRFGALKLFKTKKSLIVVSVLVGAVILTFKKMKG